VSRYGLPQTRSRPTKLLMSYANTDPAADTNVADIKT
jgi:hypothetical protein